MYTLNWQPPYDWSWMLGFLAARAVSGVETVAEDYYARSLAVGEYRGVVTAIPDIARHTLHINLSAGLEPVAAECLAKMSRLFDLQCNPQIVNGALGKLGAARPGLRLPGCIDAFEQGVRAILGQLVSVAMAAKLTAKVVQLYGERLDDFPEYICFPTPQRLAAADPQALKDAKAAGADSFWFKDFSPIELLEVMDRTIDGRCYWPKEAPDVELGNTTISALTETEKEVLHNLVECISLKKTAEKMFVEESTVKTHLKSIYQKVGCANKTELLVLAMQVKLVLPKKQEN